MNHFRSILVANRGEIALRVMRTAHALGYRCVAVYSEADAGAAHLAGADDTVLLGAAPLSESYLNIGRIVAAARASGAGAIHPGYGFLSENADFARACAEAGLVFIGPTPEAIELMGNKAAAKRRMIAAGVPCVPGYEGEDQSDAAFIAAAEAIGYPLMVKAAAGGGGRGMRLVSKPEELHAALAGARSEAANAFGSGELILEKAIIRPRHVELQVFADTHGNVIHLGERDCSVQRRHQKVIEEAPCPVMTDALRERMGAAAVEAARSIGYRGAGTVEFLLDQSGEFYFLEMNTRLQVEHPVTELVTGLDLVALQIAVAEGKELGITQPQVRLSGHAVEVRLYAEDPARDFLPMSGRIALWQPASGVGIRVDDGIASGQEVSPFYDPMLAKLIAWGEDRDIAIARLVEALQRSRLFGLPSNRRFLTELLSHPQFRAGAATTAFIAEAFAGELREPPMTALEAAIAAVLQFRRQRAVSHSRTLGIGSELLDWSSSGSLETHFRYVCGEVRCDLRLRALGNEHYALRHALGEFAIRVESVEGNEARLDVDGHRVHAGFLCDDGPEIHIATGSQSFLLRNEFASAGAGEETDSGGRITAPMHGVVLEILVEAAQRVEKGERLAVLEAMKMQHELLAPVSGTVSAVHASARKQVAANDLLLEIEPQA